MRHDPDRLDPEGAVREANVPRIFLKEPGWKVFIKAASNREFCHMIAPGQDSYHRLSAGEVYLAREDEKLCLPCADRYGLLDHEPKSLREPVAPPRLEADEEGASTFDLAPIERPEPDDGPHPFDGLISHNGHH